MLIFFNQFSQFITRNHLPNKTNKFFFWSVQQKNWQNKNHGYEVREWCIPNENPDNLRWIDQVLLTSSPWKGSFSLFLSFLNQNLKELTFKTEFFLFEWGLSRERTNTSEEISLRLLMCQRRRFFFLDWCLIICCSSEKTNGDKGQERERERDVVLKHILAIECSLRDIYEHCYSYSSSRYFIFEDEEYQ